MNVRPRNRVAFFIPSMDVGGAERVTLNLLRSLSEDPDVSIDLVLCHARGGYLSDVPDNVNVVDLGASRIVAATVPLAKWLRTNKPDVLISALVTANIVAVIASEMARFKGRIVVAEHNDFATALSNATNKRAQIAPFLIRRTYPRADRVIAVSQGVATGLSTSVGLDASLISVVPNPVITPEVRAKSVLEPEHPWFTDGGGPVILAVGRLMAQKNFTMLIDAVPAVLADHDVRLVIHGEGPDRVDLQQQIDRLDLSDSVDLAGMTDNPYAAMNKAALLVMSSRFEGLPTVLIEALYCGAPVVSTDCPSGPREILADGWYGTLVPVGDTAALSKAMSAVLAESPGPVPAEAWERFTDDVVIAQYREALGLPAS